MYLFNLINIVVTNLKLLSYTYPETSPEKLFFFLFFVKEFVVVKDSKFN